MEHRRYGDLDVTILDTNAELGSHAAKTFAHLVRNELESRDEIAVILATGNSQLSFISAVAEREDIDWSRITVLHMDEYIGMADDHPASFRLWMQRNIVEKVHPKAFHGVLGDHLPTEDEVARYDRLLRELDPVVCVMGIGENGHLAFNDPPADFHTEDLVHVVEMDEVSRRQQVGEGHFPSLDETPTHAISLTIPALLKPAHVLVLAPEQRKAPAVQRALEGEITQDCPASVLRTQLHAHLMLDSESSSQLAVRV